MKMNNKNNNIFHTGFYNEFIWNMRKKIEEIENPDYTTELNDLECPYEDAYIFLHGICNIFALCFHDKYGYEICELNNGKGTCHYFCIDYYKGVKRYIDVRGITTSYEELINEFPSLKNIDIKYHKKINLLDFEDDEKWKNAGYKFAEYVIKEKEKFYCPQEIIWPNN